MGGGEWFLGGEGYLVGVFQGAVNFRVQWLYEEYMIPI
jgi:hypothetical protein